MELHHLPARVSPLREVVFLRTLKSWLELLPDNIQCVLTSRPYCVGENFGDYQIGVASLLEEEITYLLEGKIRAARENNHDEAQKTIDRLISFINKNPQLFSLLRRIRAIDGLVKFVENYDTKPPDIDRDIVDLVTPRKVQQTSISLSAQEVSEAFLKNVEQSGIIYTEEEPDSIPIDPAIEIEGKETNKVENSESEGVQSEGLATTGFEAGIVSSAEGGSPWINVEDPDKISAIEAGNMSENTNNGEHEHLQDESKIAKDEADLDSKTDKNDNPGNSHDDEDLMILGVNLENLGLMIEAIILHLQKEEVKRQSEFGYSAARRADKTLYRLKKIAWLITDWDATRFQYEHSLLWAEHIGFIAKTRHPEFIFNEEISRCFFAAGFGYQEREETVYEIFKKFMGKKYGRTILTMYNDLRSANGRSTFDTSSFYGGTL
jgi:hypothetical protein